MCSGDICSLEFVLGEHDLNENEDAAITRRAAKIITHPNYSDSK